MTAQFIVEYEGNINIKSAIKEGATEHDVVDEACLLENETDNVLTGHQEKHV